MEAFGVPGTKDLYPIKAADQDTVQTYRLPSPPWDVPRRRDRDTAMEAVHRLPTNSFEKLTNRKVDLT